MGELHGNRQIKWYRKTAVTIVAAAAVVCGCGAEKEVKEPDLSTWDAGDLDRGERIVTPMPEGWQVVDGFSKTKPERDSVVQTAVSHDRSISEGDGYYYVYDSVDRSIYSVEEATGAVNLIYEAPFFQSQQGEETDETDTGMKAYESDELWNPEFMLQVYDGSLYVSAYDQVQGGYREGVGYDAWPLYQPARVALYRLEDGNLQEVLCLAHREEYSSRSFDYLIYEGYVYYWYDIYTRETSFDIWEGGNNCIWRVPLEGTEKEAECVYAWQGNAMENSNVMALAAYGDYLYFVDSVEDTKYLYRIVISKKCLERIRLDEKGQVLQLIADIDRVYYQVNYYGTGVFDGDAGSQGADMAASQPGWKQMSFAADVPVFCTSLNRFADVFFKNGFWYINSGTGISNGVDVYDRDFNLIARTAGITLKASGGENSGVMLAESDNGLLALTEEKDLSEGKLNLQILKEIRWRSWIYYEESDDDYFYSEQSARSEN